MNHLPVRSRFAVLLLTSLLACGDDDKDEGAAHNGGGGGEGNGSPAPVADPEKKISEVTTDEAVKLCKWYVEQLTSVVPTEAQWCTEEGLERATSEGECEELAAECLEGGSYVDWRQEEREDRMNLLEACDFVSAEEGRQCHISVASYQRCIDAYRGQYERAAGELACALAENNAFESFNEETPSECDELVELCPDFYGFRPGSERIQTFDCGDGQLIDAQWACDDEPDCENGRDEEGC